MAYATATGFRASELASLTPESFDLAGELPLVRVKSSCTKNRKEAVQPLPEDVAEILKEFTGSKSAGERIWPGRWALDHKASFLIKADLDKAREGWIAEAWNNPKEQMKRKASDFLAYQDAEGRFADFHALRHTYLTMLGKLGLAPREHQDLARHSTYAMTARYTHTRLTDLGRAVQGLTLPQDPVRSEAAAATGTDGSGQKLDPNLVPQGRTSARFHGQGREKTTMSKEAENPGKQAVSAVSQGSRGDANEVEAPGIEPGCRGTSAGTSTCVARLGWPARPAVFA